MEPEQGVCGTDCSEICVIKTANPCLRSIISPQVTRATVPGKHHQVQVTRTDQKEANVSCEAWAVPAFMAPEVT